MGDPQPIQCKTNERLSRDTRTTIFRNNSPPLPVYSPISRKPLTRVGRRSQMKRLIGSSKVIGAIAVLGIAAAVVSCGPSPFGLQSAAARTPVAQSSIGAPSGQVAPGAGPPAAAVPLASAARSSYAQTNPPIQVTSGVSQEPHGILVTGTGSASGQPDQAIVTTGVQTRATTAQDAQSQNTLRRCCHKAK